MLQLHDNKKCFGRSNRSDSRVEAKRHAYPLKFIAGSVCYSEVLYSQAVRQASQYMRPSPQRRMSITAWQRQQNFSHSHEPSGWSHWAQRYLAELVPVLMKVM